METEIENMEDTATTNNNMGSANQFMSVRDDMLRRGSRKESRKSEVSEPIAEDDEKARIKKEKKEKEKQMKKEMTKKEWEKYKEKKKEEKKEEKRKKKEMKKKDKKEKKSRSKSKAQESESETEQTMQTEQTLQTLETMGDEVFNDDKTNLDHISVGLSAAAAQSIPSSRKKDMGSSRKPRSIFASYLDKTVSSANKNKRKNSEPIT